MKKRRLIGAVLLAGLLSAQTLSWAAAVDTTENDVAFIDWGIKEEKKESITNVLDHNLKKRAEQDAKTTPELLEQCLYTTMNEDETIHLEQRVYNALDQSLGYMDVGMWIDSASKNQMSEQTEASVYKGYKRDKIEMRGDRAEMSDFPLYLNTVAGGLDCRNQAIGGFSFVVKIYALPVVEIIGQFLYLLGRYGFDAQIGYCF